MGKENWVRALSSPPNGHAVFGGSRTVMCVWACPWKSRVKTQAAVQRRVIPRSACFSVRASRSQGGWPQSGLDSRLYRLALSRSRGAGSEGGRVVLLSNQDKLWSWLGKISEERMELSANSHICHQCSLKQWEEKKGNHGRWNRVGMDCDAEVGHTSFLFGLGLTGETRR